ncbi:MAG: alpha/beta fold hydrolase, partial [Myxococcales bacterium]
MAADVEPFEFLGSDGQKLSARIHLPAVDPVAWAVFAHCFTCSKDSRAARYVSSALAEKGIATLRFDFTGLGESEGEFGDTTFAHDVEDIVAAANALRESYRAPALLIGHSRGGSAVLAAAEQIPETVGVATIGAPFDQKNCSAEQIGSMKKALVVFHSPQDKVVG